MQFCQRLKWVRKSVRFRTCKNFSESDSIPIRIQTQVTSLHYIASIIYSNKSWATEEMGERFAIIDKHWKLGARALLGGSWAPSGRVLPPYQVASWSIQLFGHNRHGRKLGAVPLGGGEMSPHLTQCGQGRGLPASQVSSWSVQPFGHNTSTSQIGQTDRQDNRPIP